MRALDLPPGELFVTLQMLIAVGAGEFEFTHGLSGFQGSQSCVGHHKQFAKTGFFQPAQKL